MTEAESETLAEREMRYILEAAKNPPSPTERPTIHYSELPEYGPPGGHLVAEWNFFRGQVGRLLAEGHEGHWALVFGEQIVGVWDTRDEAVRAGSERFPGRDVFVKSIRERYQTARVMWQTLIWD